VPPRLAALSTSGLILNLMDYSIYLRYGDVCSFQPRKAVRVLVSMTLAVLFCQVAVTVIEPTIEGLIDSLIVVTTLPLLCGRRTACQRSQADSSARRVP
jgi:hypothetical protein